MIARMMNDLAIILLNMPVFEKEKGFVFQGNMFYMHVFFRVSNWPKIMFFLGLGFSSTFGLPPPVIFFRESRPWI